MAISRSDRAKQFMAFDALKGLQEAYRLKELEVDERKDLSEETLKELNEKFNTILIGDYVIITYYKNRKYIEEKAMDLVWPAIYFYGIYYQGGNSYYRLRLFKKAGG